MRKKRTTKRCRHCGATKHLKTISHYPSRKLEHVCAHGCDPIVVTPDPSLYEWGQRTGEPPKEMREYRHGAEG